MLRKRFYYRQDIPLSLAILIYCYVSALFADFIEKCGVALTIFKPCEPQVVLDSVEAVLSGDLETKPTVFVSPK